MVYLVSQHLGVVIVFCVLSLFSSVATSIEPVLASIFLTASYTSSSDIEPIGFVACIFISQLTPKFAASASLSSLRVIFFSSNTFFLIA